MNELDQLRRAMRATERPYHDDLDLTVIMRDGRRLRRRRRLAGAGAAALVSVLLVGGIGLGVRWTRPSTPDQPPGSAVTGPAAPPSATPPPTRLITPPPREFLGAVVGTGIRYGTDERVFYVVAVDLPEAPGVTIGLMAGRRTPAGELIDDIVINDVRGADRRPGFHEIGYDEATLSDARPPVPTFGYFVGPATRIVGTAGGRQVEARLARWSTDPDLVVFWFDPVDLAPGVRLDGIVARGAEGRLL
ncbi:hypothetical protein AB0K20_29010 [Micromonospora matsumotoense]|uniref:hypothetical protein n=1 Tax=Micromonospora matsumotoense TaxID=121616 RepID=UPI0034276418